MADGISYTRAKAFRRRMSPPAARLWNAVRANKLNGIKIRREHPVGPYILDFYCDAARLAIEVDGGSHDHPDRIAHDRRRTAWLKARDVEVLRFQAVDVRDRLDDVLRVIIEAVRRRQAG
ncbi:MAG: endonuclease domain-containing protein [Brevundimonas sp.]|nr:MAG: endonuclease domain-containing protein [Brevundimonas sp.]